MLSPIMSSYLIDLPWIACETSSCNTSILLLDSFLRYLHLIWQNSAMVTKLRVLTPSWFFVLLSSTSWLSTASKLFLNSRSSTSLRDEMRISLSRIDCLTLSTTCDSYRESDKWISRKLDGLSTPLVKTRQILPTMRVPVWQKLWELQRHYRLCLLQSITF